MARAAGNCGDNRLVFGQRMFEPAPRIQHAPYPVEAEPGGLGGKPDAFETKLIEQHGMEGQVEAVEAVAVAGIDRRLLIV